MTITSFLICSHCLLPGKLKVSFLYRRVIQSYPNNQDTSRTLSKVLVLEKHLKRVAKPRRRNWPFGGLGQHKLQNMVFRPTTQDYAKCLSILLGYAGHDQMGLTPSNSAICRDLGIMNLGLRRIWQKYQKYCPSNNEHESVQNEVLYIAKCSHIKRHHF